MTKETDMHWKHIYHSPNHIQLEGCQEHLLEKAYRENLFVFKFLQEKHAKVS